MIINDRFKQYSNISKSVFKNSSSCVEKTNNTKLSSVDKSDVMPQINWLSDEIFIKAEMSQSFNEKTFKDAESKLNVPNFYKNSSNTSNEVMMRIFRHQKEALITLNNK